MITRSALLLSTALLVAACGGASATGPRQLTSTATYANGTVTEGGKKTLTVESASPDPSTSTYTVKGPDGQPQAAIALFRRAEGTSARADFPTLGRHYATVYSSNQSIEDVLADWLKAQVLVGGKASLAGLQAYCDDKGIKLVDANKVPPSTQAAPDGAGQKSLPAPQ